MNLYLDAVGGISGDMFISSILGTEIISKEDFLSEMDKISIHDEFKLEIEDTMKGAISGKSFKVLHEEGHHHRHLEDVDKIIDESDLSEKVKANAKGIFRVLAEAEAKVHQTTVDHVHFHEVGAVDSIVDIIGACILIEKLNIEEIYASPLPISQGFVNVAHGKMPLPAPATLILLEGMETRYTDCRKETVTPTGAAILKYFGTKFEMPNMIIEKSGTGCGQLEFEYPNILRAILFKKKAA